MFFKDVALFIILTTLFIFIVRKINKQNIFTIDGVFAVIGFLLGLFITSLNFIYSNNYLITIGPLMTVACLLYLRFRNKLLTDKKDLNLSFDVKTLKLIKILYWICISVALITYHHAIPYYRPPIFFISISVGITMLGLEIMGSKFKDDSNIFKIILKILLISLILRGSAYFISPYPVGSDPWGHADIINDFIIHGTSNLHQIHPYYSNYPLMHLQATITNLIGNITIKESMSIIGIILILSTIIAYLLAKTITGNVNIALLSMLLLNFADFHIRWSIEVIAMTFGIAIYTMLLYLIMKNEKKGPIYKVFLILILFMIVWTHTITSFITLVSVVSLYFGSIIYNIIYKKTILKKPLYSYMFCILFIIILLLHWMDPKYPFFESIIMGLIGSISNEAGFLGRDITLTDQGILNSIMDIFGFLMYIFFGIIGCLYSLSKKHANQRKVSMIFMLVVLYFVFFVFPVMGMRDIMPNRWPAFIYVGFILFVGIGFIQFISIFKNKQQKIFFIILILLVSSFFMITNSSTNMDSPIYGKNLNRKYIWEQSEITLFEKTSIFYNGSIVTDLQTKYKPFEIYLKRDVSIYHLTNENIINWDYMDNRLVIWRETSLTRSLQVHGYRSPLILLGNDFKNYLDENFNCIFDTRGARAYI